MQATGRRDTSAEMRIRRILYSRGFRYRVDYAPIPGLKRRSDIAFVVLRIAVFVDGCYWHGCPEHGTQAKQNSAFWQDKIATNKKRDLDTNQRFEAAGWEVLRIWEHEDPESAVERIVHLVTRKKDEKKTWKT